MRLKKIGLNYKSKKIIVNVEECGALERIKGLMFISKKNAKALLLFNSKRQTRLRIHSFFVFFPFLALWLDDKDNVLEKRIVRPFTFSVRPKNSFNKLVEIPLNGRYEEVNETLSSPSVIRKVYKE